MLIEKHDKRSFIFGVPGVLLFIGGMFFATTDPIPFIGVMIFLISVPFFLIGMGFYARSRGHSSLYGVSGILGPLGLIVLLCLSDRHIMGGDLTDAEMTTLELQRMSSEIYDLRQLVIDHTEGNLDVIRTT